MFEMGSPEATKSEIIDWCVDIAHSRSDCVEWLAREGPLHEVEISEGFYGWVRMR